jgi:hypothetical protein
MKKELAQKLKDAGFKQGLLPFCCSVCGNISYNDEGLDQCGCEYRRELSDEEAIELYRKRIYIPSLSELIEACGGGFAELQKNGSFTRYTPKSCKWIAWGISKDKNGGGETPEEAVASLWLELNHLNK